MAKKGRKRLARLQARQRDWDTAKNAQNATYKDRSGFKRPGSFKKSRAVGRGKTYAPRP